MTITSDKSLMADFLRRAEKIREDIFQLNLDVAKLTIERGGSVSEGEEWFRWLVRAFAKAGATKITVSDLCIFIKKAVENHGKPSSKSNSKA